MQLFHRAVAHLGTRKEAIPNGLEKRQEAKSESISTSASPASPASPASKATATATAAATSSLDTLSASSKATLSSAAAASATPSPSDAGAHTVTEIVSTPAFTATRTTPYIADGVNATETKTGTSIYTAETYLATANATAPGIPPNELTACQINGTLADNGPFCSPINLQNLWAGFTYAITWNPALLSSNASDSIVLKYDDANHDVVWNSSLVSNMKGYANINMDKSWLLGSPGNDSTSGQNMTFYLVSNPENAAQNSTKGPMISLTVNPSTLPRVLLPKLSNKLGMEIGLPIGLVAVLIIILAIWCGIRKHDRSWRDIRDHGKDYYHRRARRRGRAGKDGGIQLEEYNSPRGHDDFSDEPYTGGTGNAFRDEVARQREEDDRYRPTVHSY